MEDAARESGATEDSGGAPAAPWIGPVEHRADVRGLLRLTTSEPADTGRTGTPSPGEAMTLAASTMRLVEAQLVGSGSTGLAAADLSTARAALREARELLDAAAAGLPDESDTAPRRRRSRLGLSRSGRR